MKVEDSTLERGGVRRGSLRFVVLKSLPREPLRPPSFIFIVGCATGSDSTSPLSWSSKGVSAVSCTWPVKYLECVPFCRFGSEVFTFCT